MSVNGIFHYDGQEKDVTLAKIERIAFSNKILLVLSISLLIFPTIWFMVINGQHIITGHESIAYRFSFVYRLLLEEDSLLWLPQGFITSLLQKIILIFLGYESISAKTLEISLQKFGNLSILLQTCLGILFFVIVALDKQLRKFQKLLVYFAAIFPIYGTPSVGISYFNTADYYQLNILLYSSLIYVALKVLTNDDLIPSYRLSIFLGSYTGLLISSKISFIFPSLCLFIPYLFYIHKNKKSISMQLIVSVFSASIVFGAIIFILYYPNVKLIQKVIPLWTGFISSPGREYDSFVAFYKHQLLPNNYLLYYISYSFVLFFGSHVTLKSHGIKSRQFITVALICTTILLSIIPLNVRPAGTTAFEVAISEMALIFILLGYICRNGKYKLLIYSLLLVKIFVASTTFQFEAYRESMKSSVLIANKNWKLHSYLQSFNKPILTVILNNNYGGVSIEKFFLKGFSDVPTWFINKGKTNMDKLSSNLFFQVENHVDPLKDNNFKDFLIVWFGEINDPLLDSSPHLRRVINMDSTKCYNWDAGDKSQKVLICQVNSSKVKPKELIN